jgi:hypothetical protein
VVSGVAGMIRGLADVPDPDHKYRIPRLLRLGIPGAFATEVPNSTGRCSTRSAQAAR